MSYPYDALFQAIGDSLDSTVKIAGQGFSISVKAFVESIRAKGFDIAPTPAPAQGALTDAEIERLALANGFKRKQQPDGTLALNPYVFDFARAVRGQVSDAADADKRDAARYRWLRQCAAGTDQAYVCLTTDFESMDEACDEAIQAQAGDAQSGEA